MYPVVQDYQNLLRATENCQNSLSTALQSIHYKDVDSFYNEIVKLIAKSANETLPKNKFNKHAKPYWGEAVKTAHRNQRIARRRWIKQGKPRGNDFESYSEYKLLKRKFTNIQKKAIQNIENRFYEELEKTQSKTFGAL